MLTIGSKRREWDKGNEKCFCQFLKVTEKYSGEVMMESCQFASSASIPSHANGTSVVESCQLMRAALTFHYQLHMGVYSLLQHPNPLLQVPLWQWTAFWAILCLPCVGLSLSGPIQHTRRLWRGYDTKKLQKYINILSTHCSQICKEGWGTWLVTSEGKGWLWE